jgi:hypothetical protein
MATACLTRASYSAARLASTGEVDEAHLLQRTALALALAVAVFAVVASAAYAFTDYVSQTVYANGLQLGPGGYTQTGFNYRTENDACRSDNSGRMSVSYINTNEVRVTYSGVIDHEQRLLPAALHERGDDRVPRRVLGVELQSMTRRPRPARLALSLVAVAAAAVGAGFALAHPSGAVRPYDARSAFAVFASQPAVAPPAEVASSPSLSRADLAQTRLLASNLGRFHSRLFIYPERDDRNVCFGLVAATPQDPGMVYCYSPGSSSAPSEIAGEHFSVVAPESVSDGTVGVQLFGVADDEVATARVEVDGRWLPVRIARNGFYLDLPGVGYEQMGRFEAKLRDGTTQTHDIRTGTRIG